MTWRPVPLCFVLFLVACGDPSGPPVIVRNVVISSPATGMPMAAGYLEIENRSGAAIRITAVTSPEYESVEMHETTVEDGVARMRELAALDVADSETVIFERGGKHLMLMRPVAETDSVTLNFFSDGLLLVTVEAERAPATR